MAGHGCPPEDRAWLRRAKSVSNWLALLCALIGVLTCQRSIADEVELHLRASWGGGAAVAWNGAISVSSGTLEIEHVLGVEADAGGIAVPQEESLLRILPRTPRTYDGLDVIVRAPLDAMLRVQMAPATNQNPPASFDIPLKTLINERVIKELDGTGNRVALHRTPGDLLRFEGEREHLVFESGEKLQASIVPYRIDAAKGTSARCSLRLISVNTKTAVWQKDDDVTLDAEEIGRAHV